MGQSDPNARGVLEICEIGDLAIRSGERWHPVRGERTRTALASLSMHLADGLRTESLIEAIWPSPGQPATARQSLANLVARLRSTYGDGFIVTTGDGYRLGTHVGSDRDQLLAEVAAASLVLDRSPSEALRCADRALGRVRGRPWHDVEFPVEVDVDRAHLEQHVDRAHRIRAHALASLDRAAEAIPILERLVEVDPTDESIWFDLAAALADLDRRVDALRVLRRARQELAEYGLAPGQSAAELERRLLRGSPETPGVGAEFPSVPTPLVGRDALLAEVAELLRSNRMVTLCGPAGVGKTRLAVELAGHAPADERHFIDLSPLRGSHSVPSAVATALDVAVPPGTAPTDALTDAFRTRTALLVFDNCEHVVGGAADLVAALVAGCPSCSVLATSREHLGIGAERIVKVDPLPTGPHDAGVELFFDRAHRIGVALSTDLWRDPVAQLCQALDGLPLAIELAAGRTSVLTPAEIFAALEERFVLLRDAGSGASLEDAIGWSWDLLDDTEQRALHGLSVFRSGATLDAASRVLELDRWATLDLAERLSRKSLLSIRQSPTQPTRLELLDSIRHFVLADAEREGTIVACRDAHVAWVDDFTIETLGDFGTGGGNDPLAAIDAERHELRAALDHTASHRGDAATGVRIAHRCFDWWRGRSGAPEGVERLKALLPIADLDIADLVSASATLASLARITALPDSEVDALVADARRLLAGVPPSIDRDRMELRLAEAEFDDRDPTLGPRLRRLVGTGEDPTALHLLSAWTIANAPHDAPSVAAEFAAEAQHCSVACQAHAAELEGLADVATGRLAEASDHLVDAIDLHRASDQTFCAVHCCESVAWLVLESGDIDTGRSLLASTQGLRRRHGRTRAGFEEQAITGALRHLGELPEPDLTAHADDTVERARLAAAQTVGGPGRLG